MLVYASPLVGEYVSLFANNSILYQIQSLEVFHWEHKGKDVHASGIGQDRL